MIEELSKIETKDGLIFPFKPDRIYRRAASRLAEVNIAPEKRNLHSLRHTCATNLIRKGVPLAVVSRLLGHSTIKVTVDLYFHLADREKAEAIERL